MRVAIPVTETWLCPRFDCARRLVLVEVRDHQVSRQQVVPIDTWPGLGRADRLARMAVELLICGGLCRWDKMALQHARVMICGGVSGPVDAIVAALTAGQLEPEHDYWNENTGGGNGPRQAPLARRPSASGQRENPGPAGGESTRPRHS
jgi:predicted Fe-Mo cluster-binding NifX family protein